MPPLLFRPTDVRPGRPVASAALAAALVLGGSALRHFRVVVDCLSATAVFLRPGDGGP